MPTTRIKPAPRPARVRAAAAAVLTGILTAGGCGLLRPAAPDRLVPELALTQDDTLDIQVERINTRLRYTNTTARTLPAGRVWLNRRYSRVVGPLPPGESVNLSLFEFFDDEGDTFRGGGFFATRDPVPVVLAQLEAETGELIGFVTIRNEMN